MNADFRSPLRTHILNAEIQKSQCFSHFFMYECEVISCRPGAERDR